ncbi:Adenylate kinase 2, chloroplastic [Capsicum annuum]|uniref:adenylate kinase n=1 Tax=Capsicum annuum TaxID=4072 RepID=A0A2G3AGF2_CAPAN|nr:Adenylate kinase 2, chloroplastic [Capsicum annuum]
MFTIKNPVLFKVEVIEFYANLKFLKGWVISSSAREVEIILDSIKLGGILGILFEGLKDYIWKNDVGCLLTRKFTQEDKKKKPRNVNKGEMDPGHKLLFEYDLMHIAAEDLPRAEIAAGSKNRMQAKKSMDKGKLAPDEIVVTMVKEQLNGPDSQEKGWLLDGYPRSSSQAITLKEFGLQPDLHIHLEVPKEILVERVVGRRLDLITVKIYHLKYSPLETEEIESKLT